MYSAFKNKTSITFCFYSISGTSVNICGLTRTPVIMLYGDWLTENSLNSRIYAKEQVIVYINQLCKNAYLKYRFIAIMVLYYAFHFLYFCLDNALCNKLLMIRFWCIFGSPLCYIVFSAAKILKE